MSSENRYKDALHVLDAAWTRQTHSGDPIPLLLEANLHATLAVYELLKEQADEERKQRYERAKWGPK